MDGTEPLSGLCEHCQTLALAISHQLPYLPPDHLFNKPDCRTIIVESAPHCRLCALICEWIAHNGADDYSTDPEDSFLIYASTDGRAEIGKPVSPVSEIRLGTSIGRIRFSAWSDDSMDLPASIQHSQDH